MPTVTIVYAEAVYVEVVNAADEVRSGSTPTDRDTFPILRSEAQRCGGTLHIGPAGGAITTFASCYDAARAATAMQQGIERAHRLTETAVVALRVGLHVGDVADDPNDSGYITTLTVARGLSGAARPRETVTSELAAMLLANRPDLSLRPLGELTVRGVAEPISAYLLGWEPITTDDALRVIIADDVALIRNGVSHLLADEGIQVIAEAADYDALVAAVDRQPPDLVITDIRMPPDHRDEGLRAACYIRATHPKVAVLILSQYIEASAAASLLDAQTAGIGYLLKERVSELDNFVSAVRRVANGETVIDPLVTDQLLTRQGKQSPLRTLSEREQEVLELMAQGLSNQALSARLHLSSKTVESHVRSIFIKLGIPEDLAVNRRVQAVIRWLGAD